MTHLFSLDFAHTHTLLVTLTALRVEAFLIKLGRRHVQHKGIYIEPLLIIAYLVSADGITYSFGTFLVELMNVFGEGRGSVSLIPSILVGVTLGVGPIASSMVNRYGCRAVTIAGRLF